MNMRRTAVGIALAVIALVVVCISGAATWGLASSYRHHHHQPPPVAAMVPVSKVVFTTAASVPVLVYHEMNNGCSPSAPVCTSKDPETVSTTQFRNEMAWLYAHHYHTLTLAAYLGWLNNTLTRLPSNPILITADNGIGNFLEGAQPVLEYYRFTATAFLVTGFADGAAGKCPAVRVQPGCGVANKWWDLTWPQIRNLSPRVYNFALEAGVSGHFVQDYSTSCSVFDACKLPGESNGHYQARVESENQRAIAELSRELGKRFNPGAWVVPYSDLGYHRCRMADCTPQPSTAPRGWLAAYAAHQFQAVFVEDAFRNGRKNERFRDDINGWMDLRVFTTQLRAFSAAGDFSHD
jgi:peptidoglycan/xylan/chitin deacetylase (PgdA/CDA1 family)